MFLKKDYAMSRSLIKSIHAKDFLNEAIEYDRSFSRGVSVDLPGTRLLFISGTASINKKGQTVYPENFPAQTRRTFRNLTALLRSEGATWSNVVKTTCYLRDMGFYEVFNKIRNGFYKRSRLRPFPASTCVEAKLCRADLLVEIELIAVVKV